jgi:CheY-like chemotaxis protein
VTIQRVIELTFTHEDVRVVSVSDGRRALQWLEAERPDIVLADVNVPEVDGYAIAEHVKRTPGLQQVPVLLLAGAFEPVDQGRIAQIGCEGVLIKPFEPQQLVSRVKELFARPVLVPHDDDEREDRVQMEGGNVTRFPTATGVRGTDTAGSLRVGVETPGVAPEPLEPPDRPVWELGLPESPAAASRPAEPAAQPQAPAAPRVSLVSAFSALLAAEQSTLSHGGPSAAAAAPITEATVEDAVRRVLVRMTDDLVRRLVLETAERLIKEEIEKIKSQPE